MFIKAGFEILESKLICRMIENRKDNKKMHRLWLQIKLIKNIKGKEVEKEIKLKEENVN